MGLPVILNRAGQLGLLCVTAASCVGAQPEALPPPTTIADGVIDMKVGGGAYYWVSNELDLSRRSVAEDDARVLDQANLVPGLQAFVMAGDGFAVWGQQDAFVGPTLARVAWDDGREPLELPSSMWASAPAFLLAHRVDDRPVLVAATSEPTSAQPETSWLTQVDLDTLTVTPRFPTFTSFLGPATVEGQRAWLTAQDQSGWFYATFATRTPSSLTPEATGLRSPIGPFVTPDGVYVVDNDLEAHVQPRLYRIARGRLEFVAGLGDKRFDGGVWSADAMWLVQRRDRRLTRVALDGSQRVYELAHEPASVSAAGDHLAILVRDEAFPLTVRYTLLEQPLPE